MTGEITLSGLSFQWASEEKILAAHRAGIRRILLPSRNEADIEDCPKTLQRIADRVCIADCEVIDAALEVLVANPPPPPIVTSAQIDPAFGSQTHRQRL